MMPKKTEFFLSRRCEKIDKNTPIIFLTARNQRRCAKKVTKLAQMIISTKPFDTELLLYKIKAILQRSAVVEDEEQEQFKISNIFFDSVLRQLRVGIMNTNFHQKKMNF